VVIVNANVAHVNEVDEVGVRQTDDLLLLCPQQHHAASVQRQGLSGLAAVLRRHSTAVEGSLRHAIRAPQELRGFVQQQSGALTYMQQAYGYITSRVMANY